MIDVTRCSIVLMFVVFVSVSFAGDALLDPANLRVSSYADDNTLPLYAINGAGLAAGLDNHSDSASQTMWKTAFAEGNWAGWFEVDFGQVCDVNTMVIFNFNDKWSDVDNTEIGVGPFRILVSDDGVNYVPFGGVYVAAKSPDKDREPPIEDSGCPPQVFDLGFSSRFVKLRILDNHGYRHSVNGVVGLSELLFYGTQKGVGGNIPYTDFTVTSASAAYRGDLQYLVDGTGLIDGTYGGHDWHHGGDLGETGWSGYKDADGSVTLTFDFNNPTNLASVEIWNLAMWFGGGDAADRFRVLVKQSGQSDYTEVVNDSLNAAGVTNYDYSQMFAINTTDVISAQLVIDSTSYAPATIASLSEVRFVEMTEQALPFVNLDEFGVLSEHWQVSDCNMFCPCIEADWYYDGIIDISDMQMIAEDWLR